MSPIGEVEPGIAANDLLVGFWTADTAIQGLAPEIVARPSFGRPDPPARQIAALQSPVPPALLRDGGR